MMKKTIAALMAAGLMSVSGVSMAADNAISQLNSGVYVENDNTGCSILRDRVTVNLSVGTTAIYNCRTALNKINLAACHTAGSTKPTPVPCVVTGQDQQGNPTYNGANCTAAGVAATPVQTTNIDGRRGYVASTTGGSVGASSLNSTTCTTAALGALPAVNQ